MSRKIVLSQGAKADLRQIALYTLGQWGEARMLAYTAELKQKILFLADNDFQIAIDRAWIEKGLRSVTFKRTYHIFFKSDEDRLYIVRILHHKRDWQTLLAD